MNKYLLDDNNELEIINSIDSDFVVKVYDHWVESKHNFEFIYIQMELCDQTLKDVISQKFQEKLDPILDYVINCEISRQLFEAINYLHTQEPPIIHRDLKPSNVLVKYEKGRAITS